MFEPLLIHNDNTKILDKIKNRLSLKLNEFDFEKSDLDTYITNEIIPILQQKQFNILFIKDNLSQNYVELYGILLSYHIRLSSELGYKRFVPIVIISDVDGYILNKLTPMANVLFTKNTFVARNEILSYNYFEKVFEQIQPFSDFKKEFLDLIHIDPPQDYLSHHSIANEWAMLRWSEYLEVTTDDIKRINEKISSMLYFKYLKEKFPIEKNKFKKCQIKIKETGKILYIDDEWEKGWGNILKSLHSDLHVVEERYKDRTKEEIIKFVLKKVSEVDPDLVILDMRLHEDDFKKDIYLDELTGIEIFQKIKIINEGTQFVIFTASNNAKLLEELQSYDTNILSYIKKEHPDDNTATTQGNINKLTNKINEGLERKYLKKIWNIQKNILSIENINEDVAFEVKSVFEILNSNIEKSLIFAMITIFKPLEFFKNNHEYNNQVILIMHNELISVNEENFITYYNEYDFRQRSHAVNHSRSIKNKVWSLLFHRYNYKDKEVFKKIEEITRRRNEAMHRDFDYSSLNSDLIISWFSMLEKVIFKIYNNK